MLDVFISYGSPDRGKALDLFTFLEGHGFRPWMDKKKLLPGVKWRDEIEASLNKSDVCVFLLSTETTYRRGFFQREMKLAFDNSMALLDNDIFIVPIKLDSCEVPQKFGDIQYLDLSQKVDWTDLLPSLTLAAQQRGIVSNPAEEIFPFVSEYVEISENHEKFSFLAKYPKIVFPTRPDLAKALNAVMEGEVFGSLLAFKNETLQEYDATYSNSRNEMHHVFNTEVLNDRVLSLSHLVYHYFSGAAHGNYGRTSLNISTRGGSTFQFEDMIDKSAQLERLVLERIYQMDGKRLASERELIEAIKSTFRRKTWFRKGQVVFHFDPYEVFCFAKGDFDIVLSVENLLAQHSDSFNEFGKTVLSGLLAKD